MADTLSSRRVTTRLHRVVWPRLATLGFDPSGRGAWRASTDRIDAVSVWAIGVYNAPIFDTIPASFKVSLGVVLRYVPQQPFPSDARPDPAECHLRRELRSRVASPEQDHGLWLLDADGSNLDEAVAHAGDALLEEASPWFERFSDPSEILRTLEEGDEDMSGTWGFGGKGSPLRNQLRTSVLDHLNSDQPVA